MAKKKKEKSFSSFVNNPIDFTLLITILLLLSIGLVMVLSASSPSALSESGNSYAFFSKQLIFAILGIVAMLFISKIDYRFYQKFYKQSWWIALILLALVLSNTKLVLQEKFDSKYFDLFFLFENVCTLSMIFIYFM